MSFTRLQAVVDQHLEGRDALRILEAGCGSASHLRFGPGAHLVGIDISERQLDRNGALDEKIVGDLQSHPLGSGYDLIVCWDVLEHLPRPDDALENMLASVAPGGLLVIAAPDPASGKGLATKLTPYRVHVWAYKLVGFEGAGQDDRGPFRTHMRFAIRPARISRLASGLGFQTVFLEFRESGMQSSLRSKIRLVGRAWERVRAIVRRVSGGRIDPAATDFTIVLRAKP
ncbi:MAG: class I SAM-dependent methyltransferase [Solirubrobacterales bacterium]|nr:class I SAM-dependent methyltransferase [Solirubrobacterales bacterium]